MKINWKYAFGEIAIVIVGITLAFWLNNWGASLSDKKLQREYLENLLVDLESETKHLKENNQQSQEKIRMIRMFRPSLASKEAGSDSLSRNFFQIARIINFRPENTTYETLINSGDLKLINEFDLRRNIQAYYTSKEELAISYKRLTNIYQKYLADYFIHEMDYTQFGSGKTGLLNKPLLSNILSSMEGAYFIVIQSNTTCLERNSELREQITQFLGN